MVSGEVDVEEAEGQVPGRLYTATSEAVAWAECCRNHAHEIDLSDVTGGVGLSAETLGSFGPLEVSKALRPPLLCELTFELEALAGLTTP